MRFQPQTVSTPGQAGTPLRRHPLGQPGATSYHASSSGRDYPTDRANPTSPAGFDPRNVDLLIRLGGTR